jgi:hypothetical protein
MRGALDAPQYAAECELVRGTLGLSPEPHWKAFLERWPQR